MGIASTCNGRMQKAMPAQFTLRPELPTASEGFVDLFNGYDLTGWRFNKPGGLERQRTECSLAMAPNGSCPMSTTVTSNSNWSTGWQRRATAACFCEPGHSGHASGKDFHEIQLLDDTAPKHANVKDANRNGSLWSVIPARPVLRPAPNQWHRLRIKLVGSRLTVAVNGQQVLDGNLPPGKPPTGRIGLQAHQSRVQFRNIRVKRITSAQSVSIRKSSEVDPSPQDQPTTTAATDKLTIQTGGDGRQIAVSPDGLRFAVTGSHSPGRFQIYETRTGDEIRQVTDPDRAGNGTWCVNWSPDGDSLLYCTGNFVRALSTDGKTHRTWEFPAPPQMVMFPKRPWAMAFYREREVHRTKQAATPLHLRIWDWKNDKVLFEQRWTGKATSFLSVSPDERFVTAAGQHRSRAIHPPGGRRQRQAHNSHRIRANKSSSRPARFFSGREVRRVQPKEQAMHGRDIRCPNRTRRHSP